MAMRRERAQREVAEACREFPLFEDLEEEALEELSRMCLCHDYPENNFLLYQDDPPERIYLVLEGRVKLTLNDARGKVVVLSVAEPGELVGAAAVLGGHPEAANAVTDVPSRLASFKGDPFRRWLDRRPEMRQSLLTFMSGQLRDAHRKIGVHALMNVKDRLLYTLMEIADRHGRGGDDGESVVVERPTHQELARRIGSSREVVTRALDELVQDGVLEGKGKVIEVPETALVLRQR